MTTPSRTERKAGRAKAQAAILVLLSLPLCNAVSTSTRPSAALGDQRNLAYNGSHMESRSLARREASFIEPMECLAVSKLPDDSNWVYEIKLDAYRAIAVKSAGNLNLFSRRRNSFNRRIRSCSKPWPTLRTTP